MIDGVLEARRAAAELVLRNKDKWADDLQRHLADAQAVYRAAIVALEQARAALEEEVRVGGWLAPFPETGGQPPTALMPDKQLVDPFTGRPEQVVVPQRPFTEVLGDLRRDADELPQRGPVQVSDMGLRASRPQTDRRPDQPTPRATFAIRCSQDDTPAGWGAKDLLERVKQPWLTRLAHSAKATPAPQATRFFGAIFRLTPAVRNPSLSQRCWLSWQPGGPPVFSGGLR